MSQRSSAAVQRTESVLQAHCFVCAPWRDGWALKKGETSVSPRIIHAENVEGMQEIVDELREMRRREMLPCKICFRPIEAYETAPDGSYLLSFRFFEANRAIIAREVDSLFAKSGVFDIVPHRFARAHGLATGRVRIVEEIDEAPILQVLS